MWRFVAIWAALCSPLFFSAVLNAQTGVLTNRNDNARTGLYAAETILTPANVNATGFGKVAIFAADGQVYAQPLYVPNVTVAGGAKKNLVIIATEHDSVYAYDANGTGTPGYVWKTSFLGSNTSTVPSSDVSCGQITPEIGVTATPVVDPGTGTVYVVAASKTNDTPPHYLQAFHALNLSDGSEKPGSPVVIGETIKNGGSYQYVSGPSVNGTGDGAVGGVLTFNAFNHKSRPGMIHGDNTIYTFWSSHCDIAPSHGWVLGYDPATFQLKSVFNTTPNGGLSTLWNSGGGPAMDSAGKLYTLTGNGTFETTLDANGFPNKHDFGDAFSRLGVDSSTSANSQNPNGWGLKTEDYFTAFNHAALSMADRDIGSGGLLLLPSAVGSATHPSLLTGAGKEGRIYLVDRDNMGHFDPNVDHIVQELPNAIGSLFASPGYFNGAVYYGGVSDNIKAFTISNALLSSAPASKSANTFPYPGATPSISANGNANGIVWAVRNGSNGAELHAYDATNLANHLYDSTAAGTRDASGGYVKYVAPTIAAGRVYVGTSSNVTAFGLLAPSCAPDAAGQIKISQGGFAFDFRTRHYFQRVTLTNTSGAAIPGPVSLILENLRPGVTLMSATGATTCGAAPV